LRSTASSKIPVAERPKAFGPCHQGPRANPDIDAVGVGYIFRPAGAPRAGHGICFVRRLCQAAAGMKFRYK
jgi:hypothetical protein